ncbi:DUF2599 domain-containing protein [Pseudomonas cedrina]|uniref:DUF2599 domain-containing protein n=1 Tax=Pseudomonas cedrina TaxID=651740 RepID=UPI003EDB065E
MSKYTFEKSVKLSLLIALIFHLPHAQSSPGTDAVAKMRYYYNLTARDCGNGRLASQCSGLPLRGIDSRQPWLPWDPSPYSHSIAAGGKSFPNVSSGGVSVSWLRHDVNYNGLGLLKFNGFALKPNDHIDREKEFPVTVLCAFVIDSWTNNRNFKGCKDYLENNDTLGVVEDYCQVLGVSSPGAWVAHYKKKLNAADSVRAHKFQCGFDTLADYFGTYNKADAFNTFVESRKLLASDPETKRDIETTQSELRLETWPDNKYWRRDWSVERSDFDAPTASQPEVNITYKQLPVLAFIYVADIGVPASDAGAFQARALAQDDQRRWVEQGNEWRPVIQVDLPKSSAERAFFAYNPGDQSPYAPEPTDPRSCDKYVEKVEWDDNYQEPVLGKISSLRVTPTACARKAGVGKTDEMFAELANLAANDPNRSWNFDNIGSSMRRQLACHLDTPSVAQNKPDWGLEPRRPYLAHADIMKLTGNEQCNPH